MLDHGTGGGWKAGAPEGLARIGQLLENKGAGHIYVASSRGASWWNEYDRQGYGTTMGAMLCGGYTRGSADEMKQTAQKLMGSKVPIVFIIGQRDEVCTVPK